MGVRGGRRGRRWRRATCRLFKFKIKIIQLVILIDRRAVKKKKMRGQVTRESAQDLHLTSRCFARPMKKKGARERGTYVQNGTMLMSTNSSSHTA